MKNILSEENLQNLLINYKVAMTEYLYDKVLGDKYNSDPEVKSFIIKLFIKTFDGEYVFAKS